MIILGAGMAGLMAAAMLRNNASKIIEAQSSIPKNHSAVLRFKSSIVGDALNIPFKKVKALKTILPWKNPMADVMAYSLKTNGDYTIRSITSANNEMVERWIAPSDFIEQMIEGMQCSTEFGRKVGTTFFLDHKGKEGEPIISTLPMPVLMDLLGWENVPEFKSQEGITINIKLSQPSCSIYGSMYIPDPKIGPYRISLNGDEILAEVVIFPGMVPEENHKFWAAQTIAALGIPEGTLYSVNFRQQKFMKILPIDEDIRKKFILWATDKFNIYSLGRFATWRPGLLLDDLINDIRVIQKISQPNSSNYELRK